MYPRALISIAAGTCKLAWFLYFLQGKEPFICTMYQLCTIKVKLENMLHYTWYHEDGGGFAELFFLIWAQSGGEWLVSNLNCFTHGEGAPGVCVVGSWVGCKDSLDIVHKRKVSCPCCELNTVPSWHVYSAGKLNNKLQIWCEETVQF